MIPRVLHTAWIGPAPMPERERNWVEQIGQMNRDVWEQRIGGNELLEKYGRDPYVADLVGKKEKWAFVADRIRVLLLREQGGVWLDADCQPIKPLDSLPIWDLPHLQFATGMRSPHRKDVALHRGVPMVDNTFLASAANGTMIRRLEALWTPSAPLVNGHRIGVAIMENVDYTVAMLNHRYIYGEQVFPETLVMHDAHNLGSWTERRITHAA